jgi:hypothetical protein
LPEVDGQFPQDQARLVGIVRSFLNLEPELQFIYRVGRRTGSLSGLGDLADPAKIARVEAICREYGLRPDDVDAVTDDLMRRFI